jgi:hypothetical protein
MAAFEALALLAGWLSVNGAVVLTVLLLGSLIVLSCIHLGPCVIGLKLIGPTSISRRPGFERSG